MSWIPKQDRYTGVQKKLYCRCCEEITEIEYNPEWVKDGKPFEWNDDKKYEWFIRCKECEYEWCQETEFDCQTCGYSDWNDDTLLLMGEPEFNEAKSYNYGGSPYDWIEKHKCPKCGSEVEFENSNM